MTSNARKKIKGWRQDPLLIIKSHGGRRRGAGRHEIDETLKVIKKSVSLPFYVVNEIELISEARNQGFSEALVHIINTRGVIY